MSVGDLNLIEHDRRWVGDAVILRLATALDVLAEALRKGANAAVLDDLCNAASLNTEVVQAEVDRIEEFARRFAGRAAVLADLHRREARLFRAVEALNDRMSHDPHLSAALHEVLQVVSSVRSSAAIVAVNDDIASGLVRPLPNQPSRRQRAAGAGCQNAGRRSRPVGGGGD